MLENSVRIKQRNVCGASHGGSAQKMMAIPLNSGLPYTGSWAMFPTDCEFKGGVLSPPPRPKFSVNVNCFPNERLNPWARSAVILSAHPGIKGPLVAGSQRPLTTWDELGRDH